MAQAGQAAVALENARLREMVQRRAQQLEAILEALPDALCVYDREGAIIHANTTARALLARVYASADMVGRNERRTLHHLVPVWLR